MIHLELLHKESICITRKNSELWDLKLRVKHCCFFHFWGADAWIPVCLQWRERL